MKKIVSIIIAALFITLCFTACGDESKAADYSVSEGYSDYGYYDSEPAESVAADSASDSSVNNTAALSRKLIKEVSMSVETKNYNEYMQQLRNQVNTLGGYIESADENQSEYSRSCSMVIRIPSTATDTFVSAISENATVNHRSEAVKDVTETYVDTQARLDVLRAEEKSLLEILESATSIDDIMTVRQRLSSVIADIESYEAVLRSYDNQINYSTISLSISEVEREVKQESYWSSIGKNITNGFSDVGDVFSTLFLILLSAIPYLLVIGAFAALAIIIIRLCIRGSRNKKNKAAAQAVQLQADQSQMQSVAPQAGAPQNVIQQANAAPMNVQQSNAMPAKMPNNTIPANAPANAQQNNAVQSDVQQVNQNPQTNSAAQKKNGKK